MLLVVLFNFRRRNDHVLLDVLAAHCLHDDAFHLLLFKLAQGEFLRLERFDKRGAVPAKILPDDFVHPLFHKMIWNFVLLFLECLNH